MTDCDPRCADGPVLVPRSFVRALLRAFDKGLFNAPPNGRLTVDDHWVPDEELLDMADLASALGFPDLERRLRAMINIPTGQEPLP